MTTYRNLLCFAVLLYWFSHVAFCASGRRALVIGNDSYSGNTLENARNDARAVSGALTTLGYVSTLVLDANRRTMANSIDDFSRSISPGDVAIVYYAGHGMQVSGENYLIPVDFHITDETDATSQGYPLSSVLHKLLEHGASTQIVILDACRDNPFLHSRSIGGGWASVSTSAGTFLAFGTAPGSTASDDPGEGHGLFTKALLKFVNSPLDVEQMFRKVREDVIRQSGGNQVPWTASSLIGTFHLNPQIDVGVPVVYGAASASSSDLEPIVSRSLSPTHQGTKRLSTATGSESPEEAQMLSQALVEARGLHFDQAISTLRAILELNPASALALRVMGVVLHLAGRSAEAKQTLDRAIAANPNDALAYSYRCLVTASDDAIAAETDCNAALQFRGDLPQAHIGLSLGLNASGQTTQAYAEATKAIALDPTSVASFLVRGDIATSENQRGLAQQDYARANNAALEKVR